MKIAVLIVAAGRGTRIGGEIPKQYRKIGGQTVLEKSIRCFLDVPDIETVCVAIHPDDEERFNAVIENIEFDVHAVMGGATRTDSVLNGLKSLEKTNPDTVLIHDAARPFVSTNIINDVISELATHQGSVPVLSIADAVKTLEGDTVDRSKLVRVQTPQGFHFDDIFAAYRKLAAGASFADDIEVARDAGMTIGMCQGRADNIKLTYPEDFENAESKSQMINVTGTGYDVHRIGDGPSLWLCGVEIEAGFSLQGHSDADVGLHALTDAILGAISAGDIGDHFPPSDAKWKGASSDKFLDFACEQVAQKGGIIDHVDLTLICEAPKIKPHRQDMRMAIAKILDIPIQKVSIKATTTEGLGFTGRKEGIAAQATANIRIPNE